MEGIRRFNGGRLRALRSSRGFSQAQLGQRIGAHVTSVSDWERGDNAPSGRHVASLAAVFEVSVETLYGADDDEESSAVSVADRYRNLRAELIRAGRDDLEADLRELAGMVARECSQDRPMPGYAVRRGAEAPTMWKGRR